MSETTILRNISQELNRFLNLYFDAFDKMLALRYYSGNTMLKRISPDSDFFEVESLFGKSDKEKEEIFIQVFRDKKTSTYAVSTYEYDKRNLLHSVLDWSFIWSDSERILFDLVDNQSKIEYLNKIKEKITEWEIK